MAADITGIDSDKSMYDIMYDLGFDEQHAMFEYKSSESYKINSKLRLGAD